MDSAQEFGEVKANVEMLIHGQERLRQEMQAGFLRLETTLSARLNAHSDRLGRLERWKAWVMGGIGFALVLWSVAVGWMRSGR